MEKENIDEAMEKENIDEARSMNDFPSEDALIEYMKWFSLDNYDRGESSSSVTPLYVNEPDEGCYQPLTPEKPRLVQGSLSSLNVHSRIGASNNIYHPNLTSSSPSYHFPEEIPFGDSIRNITVMIQDPTILCRYACSVHGAKHLGKFIKTHRKSHASLMISLTISLATKFLDVASNSSGRRVIMDCFKDLTDVHKRVLSIQVVLNFLDLARDKSGCILLNDCLPYMEGEYKHHVLKLICCNVRYLAQDCYGTYVVQQAITTEHPMYTCLIVQNLSYIFTSLSTQKQGSHLVEKCINCLFTRKIAVEAFLKLSRSQMLHLACNEYGNFVIQKALLSTMGSPEFALLHLRLRMALLPLVEHLQRNPFGKKVAFTLGV